MAVSLSDVISASETGSNHCPGRPAPRLIQTPPGLATGAVRCGGALPWANAALGPVVGYVMQSVLLMLLVVGMERLSVGWTRRRAVTAIALVLVGIALNGVSANQPLTTSLLASGVTGVAILTAYVGVLRYDPTMAPIIVGVIVAFQQIRHGVAAAYPGSVTGHLLAVVVVAALAASWTRLLRVNNLEDRSAGSLTPST